MDGVVKVQFCTNHLLDATSFIYSFRIDCRNGEVDIECEFPHDVDVSNVLDTFHYCIGRVERYIKNILLKERR